MAVTFDEAIVGVKDPEVRFINSESSLLDNLAEAEVRLRRDKVNKKKTLTDRLAEARVRAGASSHEPHAELQQVLSKLLQQRRDQHEVTPVSP